MDLLSLNTPLKRSLMVLYGLIFLLSSIALAINHFFSQYLGNNYFPENSALIPVLLLLIMAGMRLTFEFPDKYQKKIVELTRFFAIMSLIAYASNAIQYTSFSPIDTHILSIEHQLHIDLTQIMKWSNQYPLIKLILIKVYDTLPYQMCFLPLILILLGRHQRLEEYYFLMLSTVLIGFSIYYFFPTIAPASTINGDLFSQGQFATGLKFYEIHLHLQPSTNDGGLIAMPSFHVIWAILCSYLLKEWILAYKVSVILNTLLIFSCVLLGWHYVLDVVGALLVVGFAYLFLNQVKTAQREVIFFETAPNVYKLK